MIIISLYIIYEENLPDILTISPPLRAQALPMSISDRPAHTPLCTTRSLPGQVYHGQWPCYS